MVSAMSFRPTLWATVAATVAMAVLIGLGTWQLDRRVWKQQILETRAQRIAAPALTRAETMGAADGALERLEYRPIRLSGQFDHRRTLKLLSRTRNGRPGFHVISPLVTDGASRVVLVDRGWMPVDGDVDLAPAPAGRVAVDGYVRKFETPGRFTPDNVPATGTWFYFDRAQMAGAVGAVTIAPFYVQQAPDAASPGVYPAGGVPDIALRNPHLQYAITWYALAIVLLVIYVVFHVPRRAGEEG